MWLIAIHFLKPCREEFILEKMELGPLQRFKYPSCGKERMVRGSENLMMAITLCGDMLPVSLTSESDSQSSAIFFCLFPPSTSV
jgi:hypothetical protein